MRKCLDEIKVNDMLLINDDFTANQLVIVNRIFKCVDSAQDDIGDKYYQVRPIRAELAPYTINKDAIAGVVKMVKDRNKGDEDCK